MIGELVPSRLSGQLYVLSYLATAFGWDVHFINVIPGWNRMEYYHVLEE